MNKRKKAGQKSLARQIRRMVQVMIPVLIVYIVFCSVIIRDIQKQTVKNLDQIFNLYVKEVDNRFLHISSRLLSIMINSDKTDPFSKYMAFLETKDKVMVNYSITKLQENFISISKEYGAEYHFFLWFDDTKQYVNLDIEAIEKETNKDLKKELISLIQKKDNFSYSIKQKWDGFHLADQNYLYKVVKKGNVYLGCYVNVVDLLKPFYEMDLGVNGYVQLESNSGEVLGCVTSKGLAAVPNQKNSYTTTVISNEFVRAPFSIQIYVSAERIFGMLAVVFISIVIIAVILITVGTGMILYMQKRVLKPIVCFTNNLQQYDDNDYVYTLTDNHLLELEQMDEQFKKMMHQIKKMKITLYEQELEKQQMEMDSFKLQIRPHFYLNCLNFIHSMIDFKQYDNAKRMTEITSSYLTYIFRNSQEKVSMKAEIAHCRDYLDILLLRYKNGFEYYIELNDEVEEAVIFPFLIQVFVENAVKHALSLDKRILISITVFPEEQDGQEYINIYISDTGKGFPAEVLQKLSKGEKLSDKQGEHLGIGNILKRFHYFYGEDGRIILENSNLGGAVIDIHIPKNKCTLPS